MHDRISPKCDQRNGDTSMRVIKYLSPTSISLWGKDREEFYLKYLADERPPRIPQSQPMSIGSAFDAYLKNYLHERLYGKGTDPMFELETILQAQVEPHNLEWARKHGKHVFRQYMLSGAAAELMKEIQVAGSHGCRFEFTLEREVTHESQINGVNLLGKPDMGFKAEGSAHVILDYKVNGYCSKTATSPKPGYIWAWPVGSRKPAIHPKAQPIMESGIMINCATRLEQVNIDWARQLAIYGWLLGMEVGEEFITGIEQICGAPTGDEYPNIRIVKHRCKVGRLFQLELFGLAARIMRIVKEGPEAIFSDLGLNRKESLAKCGQLDEYHKGFEGVEDKDKWLQADVRQHSF